MKKSLFSLMLVCLAFIGVAKAQQALPYSYGFEDNDLTIDGWTTQNPSGLNASEFGINTAAAQTGSYGFRFSSFSDRGESTQYLISPELNAPKGVTVQFSYKVYSSYTSGETFQVGYSTTDDDIASFTFGAANNATNTAWAQTEEFLFPAGTKYIAVYYSANYQYRLYVDDFTFAAPPACLPALNLAVTTDGENATVTWEGTAANGFIVTVNGGTPVSGQTSPYTFNVDLSTTYEVVVTADCGADGTSDPASVTFTSPDCVGGHTIGFVLNDSYGDGWSGNAIKVVEGCGDIVATLTIEDGTSETGTLSLCGDYYEFVWVQGSYPGEASWTFTEGGVTIFSGNGSSMTAGDVLGTIGTPALAKPTDLTVGTTDYDNVNLSWTENGTATAWEICINGAESNLVPANTNVDFNLTGLQPDNSYSIKVRSVDGSVYSCWTDEITVTTPAACDRPTGLTADNITFTTADFSWTGSSINYVAEYGTWIQVGTDQIATGTMTSYNFSLSSFSGKGVVAIRHYNVNDQFRLNLDDIEVRDADNNIVYSQNFESGSIPASMSTIDLDGDGNNWFLTSVGINGGYGMTSASWSNGTVLYPDNWLVIPDITLGGSITFNAVGQDPSAPAENFGVFVIADNQFTQAYSGIQTSCRVTDLTEGTAYAWRVKGLCDQNDSNWAFSMFKTPDDLLIFANAGDWDVLSNWTDIDGNAATALPTVDNKVRIDAAATIPAGVLATAKNATLSDGASIEIEDGGQLKQGGSVKVTMHKDITGYGAGNEEEADHYYFIATPHNCSWLEANTTFPYVLNLTDGNYDLYAFDATQELEWVNYEANSSHTEFHQGSNTGLFNKKGYLYANEDNRDLEFVGTVSSSLNSILTESLTYDATSTDGYKGWKLVGNPYSCDAYINYVDGEGTVLAADFYTLNDDKTFTLSQSNVALAPLTGALINYKATGTIQFSSEPIVTKGGMLNMTVTEGLNMVDMARVRFGEGYNLGKKSFRANSTKLYMPVEGNDYAVVYSEGMGEMPVSFKAENNGSYTLNFTSEEVSFSYLHLIDNMTGADVDLLVNPSYSFNANTTDYSSRFKLVFATGNNNESSEFAFVSNGNIIVNGEGTLQVIDMTGRIVSSKQINGVSSINLNAATGVYVLQLTNGNDVKTQKIVVK